MLSEFEKRDIAHINNNKRVRGILNYGKENESYKDFTLKSKTIVEIVSITKGNFEVTGGYVYGVNVIHKGIEYYVDCVSQNNLASKSLWKTIEEQEILIKKLKHINYNEMDYEISDVGYGVNQILFAKPKNTE